MATAFTIPQGHPTVSRPGSENASNIKDTNGGQVVAFVKDLIEDVAQKPLQPAALAAHDMFREHIIAMSISYFALIVLLILASLPFITWLVGK